MATMMPIANGSGISLRIFCPPFGH
jgi:hypothetical protein